MNTQENEPVWICPDREAGSLSVRFTDKHAAPAENTVEWCTLGAWTTDCHCVKIFLDYFLTLNEPLSSAQLWFCVVHYTFSLSMKTVLTWAVLSNPKSSRSATWRGVRHTSCEIDAEKLWLRTFQCSISCIEPSRLSKQTWVLLICLMTLIWFCRTPKKPYVTYFGPRDNGELHNSTLLVWASHAAPL